MTRSNEETRSEQLRLAKRRQRRRERAAGLGVYQIKLPAEDLARLRTGMADPVFVARLRDFLQHEIIDIADYPQLRLLCWNRRQRHVTRADAFALYERNWRHVDVDGLEEKERELIEQLAESLGKGLLNV